MLYFIDDAKNCNAETLKKHGLQTLLDEPSGKEYLGDGPGGKTGLLVSDNGVDRNYRKDAQTWSPRFGYPGTYVGFWNDKPPTPDQLAREQQLPGVSLELLDGNFWTVPILREWRENEDSRIVFAGVLPAVLRQCPQTGRFIPGEVVRDYRQLWETSLEVGDQLVHFVRHGGQPGVVDEALVDAFVGDLLAVNYRLTMAEIGLLGLIDDTLRGRIIQAGLNWAQFLKVCDEYEKKNRETTTDQVASASSNGSSQPTAAKPSGTPTGQLSPT